MSGGGDSIALLHLAVDAGCTVHVATVDHGLREAAAAEAAGVAARCAALGLPHSILEWRWNGRGNLADAARRGRQGLLADWARGAGLAAVVLGHTQDDVAETFLMRLARDAGVDGLAAMAARREVAGMVFLRPLLGVARAELRGWLLSRGLDWVEDPTNEDARFARVRARRAVAAMADAGVTAEQIAALAGRMADVRAALDSAVAEAAARVARLDRGDVILEALGLAQVPTEIRRRLMREAVMWVGSAEYGPRGAELERFIAAALEGRAATLGGCRMTPGRGRLRITREVRAVAGLEGPTDQLWDGRWHVTGPEKDGDFSGLTIRALGAEGLAQMAGAEGVTMPRLSLLATPAIWRGEALVAAPLAGLGAGWSAVCTAPIGALAAAPLSH